MNGAITVMRPKLSRLSLVLGASGVLVAGMATAAYAATTANAAVAHTPTWHTILSVPDGKTPSNTVKTVVATGRTSGWAFLSSSPVAYERIASTAWKKVRLPEKGGAVSVAQASSPNNVWAAYHTATGTHLDRWNGRKWTTVKSFGGQINGISVLSPSDVWVFGVLTKSNGGVFHFNGRTWTQVSSIEQGGYAINDRNVWAFAGTKIAHFDGKRWTQTDVAGLFPAKTPGEYTSPVLTGIIAIASNNVYAIGDGPLGPHAGNGVILHYNGHACSRVGVGGFISPVGQQVTPDGTGGLWVPAQNPEGPNRLFHYAAGKVTLLFLPGSTGLPTSSNSVSRIPGTTEVISGGTAFNATNSAANRSVVLQYS